MITNASEVLRGALTSLVTRPSSAAFHEAPSIGVRLSDEERCARNLEEPFDRFRSPERLPASSD